MTRRDVLSAGPAVPGFCLALLAVGVALGAAAALGMRDGWIIAVGVLAVLGAALPQMGGLWMAAAALAGALALQAPDPLRTAVAIGAVHLLHVLASLILAVPPTARITLRALAPTGIRFAVIQAVAQGIALAVGLLPRGGGMPLAVLAAGAAVLTLAAIGPRMLQKRRHAAYRVRS